MTLRVFLAGRVAVESGGEVVIDERRLRGRQGRLVFAYLTCNRTRPVAREELATLLWPDDPAPSWSAALSAVMSRLSRQLNGDAIGEPGLSLSRGVGHYQLMFPADVWIDLEAATSAVDRAEGAVRSSEPDGVLAPATIAASIARRPFLLDVQGEWVESQRRRLERQLIRALDCLSKMWLDSGEPGLAVETAIEATTLDPYREASCQLLMRAYGQSGNRAEAVKTFHKLRGLLALELGTEPSPDTEAIYLEMLG